MGLDYKVWLPHFHFVMQTIALSYPAAPNDVAMRKYYDLVQNLGVFLPDNPMGGEYYRLLDDYPVAPYLRSRPSFIKWTHFMKNRLNEKVGLPQTDLSEDLENYRAAYLPPPEKKKEELKIKAKHIQAAAVIIILSLSAYMHKKF